MSDNKKSASNGSGFLGLLTTLFIGLKLTGNIDWSWWWVLAALWVPLALIMIFWAIYLAFLGCQDVISYVRRKS